MHPQKQIRFYGEKNLAKGFKLSIFNLGFAARPLGFVSTPLLELGFVAKPLGFVSTPLLELGFVARPLGFVLTPLLQLGFVAKPLGFVPASFCGFVMANLKKTKKEKAKKL